MNMTREMDNGDIPVIVIDTSAFFLDLTFNGRIITASKVLKELKDLRGKARLEVLSSQGLFVSDPHPDSVRKILASSKESGDYPVLSPTDIDILALAYETGGEIMSDDFAVQNVARHMNIPILPVLQKKAKKRRWKMRCRGCGRYFDSIPADMICPVCGSEVRRKIK